MQLKKKSSFSNSVRHQVNLQKNLLCKYNNIIKKLKVFYFKHAGRNKTGRITIRHQGSGCKTKTFVFSSTQYYRGIVISKLYSPNNNSFVSLCFNFQNNKFLNILNVIDSYPGTLINSNLYLNECKLGFRTILNKLPLGSIINSVNNKNKTTYSKSAGSYSQIIEKKNKIVKIRLSSGVLYSVSNKELATLGSIGNKKNKMVVIGKAGKNRLKNIRPSVRGIAMNPVDHPHGGKSNKGMPPVTPWGFPTKNKPTVKK